MSVLAINHNSLASNVANSLNVHYSRLATSTERLSSGLRINSAADDAAGLAIRELMRSDIAVLHQGMRNVNDAISMIQTFDGALSVIDEKLIRMKELAEQAATGTYTSTQRLMIDSEFQMMASEITRIAVATDFNGVKLLCTAMKTWYTDETRFVADKNVENFALPTGINATVTNNTINAYKYVDENNPTQTISVSLTATQGFKLDSGNLVADPASSSPTEYKLGDYTLAYIDIMGQASNPKLEYDENNKATDNGWTVTDDNQTYTNLDLSISDELSAQGRNPNSWVTMSLEQNGNKMDLTDLDAYNISNLNIDLGGGTYSITTKTVEGTASTTEYTATYDEDTQTVTVNLAQGGKVTLKLDNPLAVGDTISFDINISGQDEPYKLKHTGPDPDQRVKIHFGTGNSSAEDYYYIQMQNCTTEGLGLDGVSIQTQDDAQAALTKITDAIVAKDQARSYFGSMQNRFENTYTNLSTQAENLQNAESRISDADIAVEMMTFVRNQILVNSAIAMLAQANSLPQYVLRLVS